MARLYRDNSIGEILKMGYYDLLKDMEENRCQGCMFFIYNTRYDSYSCGATQEIQMNCENKHEKYMRYVYGGRR